jgi:hypothetical protein
MEESDVFTGVSGPKPITRNMPTSIAPRRLNPMPVNRPELAHAVRSDQDMEIAAIPALQSLAHGLVPMAVPDACGADNLGFGVGYTTPDPLDPGLRYGVASALARAAVTPGVAGAPYPGHDSPIGHRRLTRTRVRRHRRAG